jgi:hypothetical protein
VAALHKRIDRFAERVFFASRHQAFQRVHQLTAALPFTEKIRTIGSILTDETAEAMRFASAALFRADDGAYFRRMALGWDGATETLDDDDAIVLFTRSAHHGVHLSEIPSSKADLPDGDKRPVYALPIVVGLLTGLAHAAATA